jgi:hypothetical protein
MRVFAVALASLVVATAAGAAAQTTRVTIYRPFAAGKLAPGLVVSKTVKGSCFSGSSADPRSDAWRCFIGNFINDPCFSSPGLSWVACPENGTPFGKRVVKLTLTKPLPKGFGNHGSAGQGNPWALKLAGGRVCTFLTGATSAYHGKRVNYGCTPTVFLAGSPNRSKPTWTIVLGTGPKSAPQTAVILVAAW